MKSLSRYQAVFMTGISLTTTTASTGDFTSAVLRFMAYAKDQELFKRITGQMTQVKVATLRRNK